MRVRLCVYAAVGLLLSGLSGAAGAWARDAACQSALQDYQVALQSYQDGLFDPAFAGFEAYILHCPQGDYVGQAHYVLADMLAQQSSCDKALAHVKAALAQSLASGLRPHALFLAARCALQSNRSALAQTYLQEAVEANAPRDIKAPALYWLGELAFQQQRYDDAKRHYTRSLQEAPEGEYAAHAHYSLGFIAQQEGDIDAALQAFAAFLKLAPEHPSATRVRFVQADLRRQKGDLKEAASAFKTLSQTLSGAMQEESLFRWAELAYELKQYAGAQNAYQQLIAAFPQSQRLPASLYGLGWSALRQEQCQAALEPWERFVALSSESVAPEQAIEARYHLGLCYLKSQDEARARRHLRQAALSGGDSAEQREAVLKVASLAYRAGDFDEAIIFYTRALSTAQEASAPRLHFLLGESYQSKGDMEPAMGHWQKALSGSTGMPFYVLALQRLGRAYAAKRDWPQAIAHLRRLWDGFPDFAERSTVALELAQAYSQVNDCEAALPLFAFLTTSAPEQAGFPGVRHRHVACLFATARYQETAALLAPLLAPEQAEPTDPILLYTLGQAQMELRRFEAAIVAFTRLQTEFPEHPLRVAMLPRLAYALEQVGRPGDALDVWQAHVQSGGEQDAAARLRLRLHMGRLALQVQRFEAALELLPQRREVNAADMAAETLFWRAEAHYHLQQWDAAKQGYQVLLRDQGAARWGDAAQLRLAAVYEQKREWDLALETYRKVRDTASDAEIIANAKRRIAAIEAGLVRSRPQPKTPPSSEG